MMISPPLKCHTGTDNLVSLTEVPQCQRVSAPGSERGRVLHSVEVTGSRPVWPTTPPAPRRAFRRDRGGGLRGWATLDSNQ